MSDCLYARLGVTPTADLVEIRRAWRVTALRTHPDSGGDPAEFLEAREAFEVLSDPDRRAGYDSRVVRSAPPGPQPSASWLVDLARQYSEARLAAGLAPREAVPFDFALSKDPAVLASHMHNRITEEQAAIRAEQVAWDRAHGRLPPRRPKQAPKARARAGRARTH